MKKIILYLSLLVVLLPVIYAFKGKKTTATSFRDGDLIFQVNPSGQGKAIQLATKSKFTHCGIIFIENGKPVVYHAVQPVTKSSLESFAAMGTNGYYEVRRLKNRDKELDATELLKMKTEAKSLLGKNYDIYFNWSDEEIYCSEFIWKIYKRAAGIEIGPLKPLKEFDLSSPVVKEIMQRRYGEKIPYDEKMVSPGDIFNSGHFETVK